MDIRVSRDKTPYNAHLHIAFLPETGGTPHRGWYFGLEPNRLTAGTGVFELAGAGLDAFARLNPLFNWLNATPY